MKRNLRRKLEKHEKELNAILKKRVRKVLIAHEIDFRETEDGFSSNEKATVEQIFQQVNAMLRHEFILANGNIKLLK